MMTDEVKTKILEYDQAIEQKLYVGHPVITDFSLYREDKEPYSEDVDATEVIEPEAQAVEIADVEHDAFDELLLTEPTLIRDGNAEKAKIVGRTRDNEGNLVGQYNNNPLLNTRVYLVEFPDGHITEYSANTIAEAVYESVNDDGYEELLFDSIVDHEYKPELDTSPSKYTTKAWKICIMWNDGSTTWHPLSDVKNAFPVQLAKYAIQHQLDKSSSFCWWIKPTLKHQGQFIKAVKSKYSSRAHKFGIRVPKSVEEALAIDKATNTTFWHDAIQKEMRNCRTAFKILEEDENVHVGYKWIKCHLIFDVKMDFTCKAPFVAGGAHDKSSSRNYIFKCHNQR